MGINLDNYKKKWRIVYLHNPKHFYLNSLQVEDLPNGDKLVTATPRMSRNNRKNFHKIALLKRKVTAKEFVKQNTQPAVATSSKPFAGIFQD
jgi:hypothetical protein